jgi:hypothetical protein
MKQPCCGTGFSQPALLLVLVGLLACSDSGGPSEGFPRIAALGPNRVSPGLGQWVIEVRGSGFQDSAVVHVNGSPRETFSGSDTELAVFLSFTDTAEPDTLALQVVNPDGSRSNPAALPVIADATSLAIDSITPRSEDEVNAGGSVAVYFNEGLNESSISDTSIVVRDENGPVSGSISYDAAKRALTFVTSLSPAHRFTAHVSNDVLSLSGGFTSTRDWTFSTSLGQTTVIDTMTGWPSLVLGLDGRPRVGYQAHETVGFSRLKVAACGGDCTRRQGWTISTVDPSGSIGGYTSLARDALGSVHFGYQDFHDGAFYSSGSSHRTFIDGNAAFTTMAASPTGALHLLYYANGDLRAASCYSICTETANWTLSTVDTAGNTGSYGSAAVDAEGGVHVTYLENDSLDLRYATCPAPCSTPTWTSGSVVTVGQAGVGSSLVVTGAGMVHATWLNATSMVVQYGTCSASCTDAANWSIAAIEQVAIGPVDYGFYWTSLAMGPGGQLEASYMHPGARTVRAASCAASCTTAGAWSTATVSFRGPSDFNIRIASLEVSSDGKRHVVYSDRDRQLRYIRY